MNYVKAIPTFLKSQECEWGVKAATHALVTGYTANEAVRFVNVLKSSEFLPKAVSTLNARYVEIAGMLTGVGVAIYTAYCSYAKESDLAAATASSKKAEPTKPFATRWLEAKADLKTAVRWAAVALFVPAVFDGIQQQMTQVPALTRFF